MEIRLLFIDGIKGIAALSIFSWHYSLYTGHLYWSVDQLCNTPLTKFLIDGCVAVCVFILLSGYSNALSINRKSLAIDSTKHFIAKRYLRIAIPTSFILSMVFLMRCLGLMQNYEFSAWQDYPQATQYYNNSTMNMLLPLRLLKAMLLSPMGDTTGVELPTWMLKYIFLGAYMVLMLHVLTNNMRTKNKIAIGCFVLFVAGYMLSPYYIPMIAGFILFVGYPYIQECPYKYILSIASFVLAFIFYFYVPQIPFPIGGVITAIFFILGIFSNPLLQNVLSIGIFKWLGKISFMVYLVHMPIICSLSHYLYMHIPIASMPLLSTTVYMITLIVVLITAYLVTIWIEDKMAKKIINQLLAKIP